jgi:two-component system phosphate regulon sensor histidine kinase PhoR
MNKRIWIILISVFVSVIGIILLQAYWINNSYTVNRTQLLKELNLALEESVKQEMNERYQRLMNITYTDNITPIASMTGDTRSEQRLDSIINPLGQKKSTKADITIKLGNTRNFYKRNRFDSIPDKVEFRVKDVMSSILHKELDREYKVDIVGIDSIFTQNLAERNLYLTHYIEVIKKKNNTLISTTAQFGSDTLNSLLTPSVTASIIGRHHVRVRIPNAQQVILKQMIWAISASLLLILIVLACFWYMLSTIFKQKQLSQIKNDFINNMTHELKTPIATVSAAVEAMQNFGVLDDKHKTFKYLDISGSELKRLSGLVEKVLNMAREEREPVQMNFEDLDFKELCDNIIHSQEIKAKNEQVTIQFQSFSDDSEVKADRFHLSNVMQNLIENSIKYSGDAVHIKLECKKEDLKFIISIADNGMGIPNKYQTKIFDQFYRVPTGNRHDVKGFGLGLHYVKSIVQKHGGTIGVSSTLNKGTKFTINLPF